MTERTQVDVLPRQARSTAPLAVPFASPGETAVGKAQAEMAEVISTLRAETYRAFGSRSESKVTERGGDRNLGIVERCVLFGDISNSLGSLPAHSLLRICDALPKAAADKRVSAIKAMLHVDSPESRSSVQEELTAKFITALNNGGAPVIDLAKIVSENRPGNIALAIAIEDAQDKKLALARLESENVRSASQKRVAANHNDAQTEVVRDPAVRIIPQPSPQSRVLPTTELSRRRPRPLGH